MDAPTLGPAVSPLVEVALDALADFAARKGFAFEPERERAVRTFLALRRAREPYDPDEVYLWGATNGFRRPKDVERLREYAQRAIDGKRTRTVNGYAIKLDSGRADQMNLVLAPDVEPGHPEAQALTSVTWE